MTLLFGAGAVWSGIAAIFWIILVVGVVALASGIAYLIFAKALPRLIIAISGSALTIAKWWLPTLALPFTAARISLRHVEERRMKGEIVGPVAVVVTVSIEYVIALVLWLLFGVTPLMLAVALLFDALRRYFSS